MHLDLATERFRVMGPAAAASCLLAACGGGASPPAPATFAEAQALERQTAQSATELAAADLACTADADCEVLQLASPGKCGGGAVLVLSRRSFSASNLRSVAALHDEYARSARELNPDQVVPPCVPPRKLPQAFCSAASRCEARPG